MQQFECQSRLLVDLASAQSGLSNSIKRPCSALVHDDSTVWSSHHSPHATRAINLRVSKNVRSCCSYRCECSCHTYRRMQSPLFLRSALGMLFTGYSGYPHDILGQCNTPTCQGSTGFHVSVTYVFPLWFVRKAISISLVRDSFDRISGSLSVRLPTSPDSDVFRLADMNDVDGLKRLFSKGLATPNDAMYRVDSVHTILDVSSSRLSLVHRQLGAGIL